MARPSGAPGGCCRTAVAITSFNRAVERDRYNASKADTERKTITVSGLGRGLAGVTPTRRYSDYLCWLVV
jgi:hypothetical protein